MGAPSDLPADLVAHFGDPKWRLSHLYWIVDEHGRSMLFEPNARQQALYDKLWYLNIVLKYRQATITTAVAMMFLDSCLFRRDTKAGIIMHTKDDAQVVFRDKIKYAYERLPEPLKESVRAEQSSAGELVFSNGSSIRVGTSMRGQTLQLLHVSEMGKIATHYPEKAREIVTGSLNTVHAGEIVIVESTAEGRDGYFYRLCDQAQQDQKEGKPLTTLSWKFHFYPWFIEPRYALSEVEARTVTIPKKMVDYFAKTEKITGHTLTREQKAWYVQKWRTQGDDMRREYPATPEEAFEASIQGAWYAEEMSLAREQGRVTSVPHQAGVLVDTWWDIGLNDENAIWLTQTIGYRVNVIDYIEDRDHGFPFYADLLRKRTEDLKYRYGRHVAGHDFGTREYMSETARVNSATKLGFNFEVTPRPTAKKDHIDAARNKISVCWFDAERCARGLAALENYRKEWDEHLGSYKNTPLHNWASNGADAFQVLSVMHQFGQMPAHRPPTQPARRF